MSVAIDHGYLPSSRFVINHDIMHCTADGVVGNHLFSGRALGISEPEDIIQIHPDLKPLWGDITAHYQRIGLVHSEHVIWDLDLNHLGRHVGYKPSVFYFGPHECRHWGDYQWLETVEFINSKNNFMALAKELNVDVPATRCFDSVSVITPELLHDVVYPCYIKAAISVSGVGIYRCETQAELLSAIGKFDLDIPVQIQEEVNTETFLNMQYQVIGNNLTRLAASEQILDGFAHQGNRFPASHAPWEAVDPMAYWLKANGMKGIFAFDVAIVQSDRGLRFPAIECNPRYNGASYPTLVADKLGIPEWSSVSLSTTHRTLADIDIRDIEYDDKTGKGVIVINWGTVLEGKLVFLMAGPPPFQTALLAELNTRL